MPYRVVVIAPDSNLKFAGDEVQQVINLLGAKLLTAGDATLRGMISILREGFDIIWFATHGDELGVYLNDGIVNISELTTLIRSSGAQLTVFNTCASRPVALTIHDEVGTEFICTIKPVPDRMAYITGTIFAQKLADGFDFFEAYEEAKPGQNSTYTYIGEKGISMPQREPNRYVPQGSPSPQMPDPATLLAFIESVKELNLIVRGQSGLVPPVRDMIVDLQTQVGALERQIVSMQNQLSLIQSRQVVRNWAMWSMAIAIALLILIITIMSHRLGVF
jgi:hypothetical protein